jgi:hypothetical protein
VKCFLSLKVSEFKFVTVATWYTPSSFYFIFYFILQTKTEEEEEPRWLLILLLFSCFGSLTLFWPFEKVARTEKMIVLQKSKTAAAFANEYL